MSGVGLGLNPQFSKLGENNGSGGEHCSRDLT